MDEAIADFISYLISEKGLAANSVEAYQRDVENLASYLKKKGVQTFTCLEMDHIVDYLFIMKEKGYASSSICRTFIAIKVFIKFLLREQGSGRQVNWFLETPKVWQLIPEVLTNEEVDALLTAPDICSSFGARDKAILEVLYACGLRVSELCTLKIYDVDDEFIKVMGKGSKERIIPIGRKAISAIDYYLSCHRCRSDSDRQQALFVSKSGQPLERVHIWRMIKKYAKIAGITKNISPHTLRHSFATHLLDHGADLRIIQEMLGHASINSTDRYTQISSSHLQKAFQEFHPRQVHS